MRAREKYNIFFFSEHNDDDDDEEEDDDVERRGMNAWMFVRKCRE
jgi:hypothetical protein